MGRRGYPAEFRRKVLDLVESGRPVADVAKALGISEVFSPGFAVRGRLGEASLQVRPLCQRSAGCRLPRGCAKGLCPKSLTTR